jgi:hypothetical protein
MKLPTLGIGPISLTLVLRVDNFLEHRLANSNLVCLKSESCPFTVVTILTSLPDLTLTMSTSASPASFSSIDESRPRLNNFRRLLSALHSTAHFYAKLLGLEATGYSQLEAGTIVPEPEFPGLHEDLGKVFKQISTLYIHE